MATIAPEHVFLEISRRIDTAVNTFAAPGVQIADRDQFQQIIIGFLRHVEQYAVGARGPRPEIPVYDYARCIEIMDRIYGPDGFRKAFERARAGLDGGLPAVLREFAAAYALRFTEAEVEDKVSRLCWGLTDADRRAIAQAYIQKFGRFLPSEWLEGGGWKVASRLEQILKEHPHMLVRIQGIR